MEVKLETVAAREAKKKNSPTKKDSPATVVGTGKAASKRKASPVIAKNPKSSPPVKSSPAPKKQLVVRSPTVKCASTSSSMKPSPPPKVKNTSLPKKPVKRTLINPAQVNKTIDDIAASTDRTPLPRDPIAQARYNRDHYPRKWLHKPDNRIFTLDEINDDQVFLCREKYDTLKDAMDCETTLDSMADDINQTRQTQRKT